MDSERRSRVTAAMAREGLDLLACRLPENVLFLTGYWPLAGVSLLLFPRDAEPICILPLTEEKEAAERLDGIRAITYPMGTLSAGNPHGSVAAILTEVGRTLRPRTVGTEEGFATLAPPLNAAEPALPTKAGEAQLQTAFAHAELRDATGLLYALRARKTAQEVRRIRVANEISALALPVFTRAVSPGVTGVELAAEVEHEIAVRGPGYKGTRHVRAFAQVATGPEEAAAGWRPIEYCTRRRMEPGDIALLELAVVADGYWSDRTRPGVAGEPSAEQRQLFDLVVRAQEAAIRAVRPGVAVGAVDAAARALIEAEGHGAKFFHITGHGTGFRYHEPIPVLAPGGTEALETGMIFSVEPGVYAPGFGGIRVEDNVAVTADGAEVLGPAEKRLSS